MVGTELTEKQEEVVEILREGRATPDYLTHQTSIDAKQTIQYHLRELRARGVVRRVHTGLYELEIDSAEINTNPDKFVFDSQIPSREDKR